MKGFFTVNGLAGYFGVNPKKIYSEHVNQKSGTRDLIASRGNCVHPFHCCRNETRNYGTIEKYWLVLSVYAALVVLVTLN